MSYRPFSSPRLFSVPGRRAALILAAGLAVALAGCDRDDANTKAINDASLKLQSLAPAGDNQPNDKYKNEVYQTVKTSLGKVNGTKAENAAAALLVAQAESGMAQGPVSEAAALERANLNDITEIRAMLGQWLGLHAMADAAAAYDPSKEVADIDARIKTREEDRIKAQQQKAAVDQQVADLQAQAKQKGDAAKAKQQEAGKLRAQVPNQTAVEGEKTLRQAQSIGRQGDELEVQAADLEAQAAQVAPQSNEIQLQIDKLTHQKELLGQARAGVLKRAEDAKAQAAQARADAAKLAEEITKRVEALSARREEANSAEDKAAAGYKAAANSANKAATDSRAQSKMAYGSAEQSLAEVEWARAQGLEAYAALLDSLAGAQPALPKAGEFKSKADEAHAAAKTALDAATDAYSAANDAYKLGGITDQERMDRINGKLADLVKATSGGSKDIRNPDAQKPEEKPAEAPAESSAAAPAGDTPQAAVQKLLDAQSGGPTADLADLFDTSSAEEKQVLQGFFGTIAPKMVKMQDAMKAKFGSDVDAASGQMGAAAGLDVEKLKNLKASDLKFTVNGDTAEAPLPTGQKIRLKNKDGKWLIEPASVGVQSAQLPMLKTMIPAMSKAIDEVTAEIKAGKYKTAQEAMAAMQTKMMGAAMQNMPNGKK